MEEPPPEAVFLSPEKISPFTVEGTPLRELSFVPSNKPLKLLLYFERSRAMPEEGEYALYYETSKGLGEPIYQGRYGKGW